MERYIEAAAALSDQKAPQCAAALRAMKPVFALLLHVAILVGMGYARLYGQLYEIYKGLPLKELEMVAGLILCFFGGTYVTLIAAFEAFRNMGGKSLYEDLAFVSDQVKNISDAQARDALVDQDRDGIADVDQITPEELTRRKLKVAMVAVDDPTKLQAAVGSLWAACLAVLATLKLQFAQTAAYALAIAEMLKFPVLRAAAPSVTWGLGKDLTHWVDPVIDGTLKLVCILLVWYLAKIRAAFYSGLRGGRMFAEAAISFCDERGWMDKAPDFIAKKPFNPDESYLDEAVGFVVAAIGFYWQVKSNFFLPFPLDWLLWPVTMLEYFLEVQVSWS